MKTEIKNWFKNHNYQWKYKLVVCLPLFLVLVAIDWITKGIVQGTMELGQTIGNSDNFISITYFSNPGAARNFMADNMGGAIALATVITVLLIAIFVFVNDKMWLIALTFLVGGSFANLLARAWAGGEVVDFISVNMSWINSKWSYINNMADNWVVIGIILLVIFLIIEIVKASKEAYKKNHEVQKMVSASSKESSTKSSKVDESKLSEKELKAYNKLKKKNNNGSKD